MALMPSLLLVIHVEQVIQIEIFPDEVLQLCRRLELGQQEIIFPDYNVVLFSLCQLHPEQPRRHNWARGIPGVAGFVDLF